MVQVSFRLFLADSLILKVFLRFEQISKSFPGVVALDGVSLEVAEGSCHALMGENGAGKSTLGKILAGICQADSGSIHLQGRTIRPQSPLEARECGIGMVHQELAFCPNLSVAENLCLGGLPHRAGFVDKQKLIDRALGMLREVEADIDPASPMNRLNTGQEQLVQIAAALASNPRVVIMDEPTSSLSAGESAHLFHLLARLKAKKTTILYVSHRMEEVFQLCDTVSVLRDGRHVATQPTTATSRAELIRQMVGRDVALHHRDSSPKPPGEVRLEVRQLSSPGKFHDISFEVRAGEILGLAGLVGAGRSEVAVAVFGLDAEAEGSVKVDGRPLPNGDVNAALEAGIGLLPEDRKRQGLVLSMNCRENGSLAALHRVSTRGWLDRAGEKQLVETFTNRLRLKAPSLEVRVDGLSGGNQQKVALAKWLARQCRILIVDEPTRGVDVGAKAEIHALLEELAAEGIAILLISSEMPELTALSDRILVMREGRHAGSATREAFDQEKLLAMMAGVGPAVAQTA